MSQTPTDSPYRWRAADLEGIRIALSIPARLPAIRAINDAMADLEQLDPFLHLRLRLDRWRQRAHRHLQTGAGREGLTGQGCPVLEERREQ